MADEIPLANTPKGGWRGELPRPILAGCTEPLHPEAPDLRGLWQAVEVEREGQVLTEHHLNHHLERVEQCGNRVVITSEGVIHDMRADGTLENGVNDVAGANLDQRISVAAVFKEGRLDLHPFGIQADKPPMVTREILDGMMLWRYGPFKVTMRRVGDVSEETPGQQRKAQL